MDNKPTIKELLEIEINIQQKGYKENAKKLISDFNAEKGNADGYSGRELFELLQNAVDAIDDSANSTVLISLQDDVLRICNNGEPFSITGFYSLMNSNLSPKKNENESIGDKGLGFRSILNLSETVRIYSGDVAVEFSKEIATEEFEKLKRSEEVQNVLNLYSNHEITRLAILAIPRIIKPSNDREYVTTIEMTLKEDVVGRIIERLNHFESQNLLFLEKLGEFKIIYDGSERLFRRKELNKENEITKIELSEENNNSLIRSDCWSIVSEEGVLPVKEDEEEKKEQNKIMIAYIPDQKKIPNNKLYSFFKTDVDFPFPVLVHGPFDLTPDRNHLVKNKDNANLLRKICNKIVDLALSIAEDRVDYTALELLTPSNIGNFSGLNDLPDYNFGNEYYDLVASKKVFPTVNGTYISFDDQPKFYGKYDKGKEIVNFLNGDGFYSLMPLSDKWETYSFIEKIAQKKNVRLKYTADEMVEGINTMLETISIEARAELWLKYIKYSNEQPSTHPKFVINDDKNTIACNIQVFLPPESNDFPTPPEFAEIFFLNKELVKNLQNQLSREFSRRELSDVLHQYNVKKYNLQNIVNTISEKLNAIQINDNELAIACYEQTLDWLFALWQNGIINKKNINLSKLALLNRTGNFMPAKELYFGKEFGNDITEELLSGDDELFLKPPKNSLDSNEVEEYINLMKKIGVKWYPREEPQPLNRDIFDSGYNEAV
ncbi:MAG: hypothetical protein LHW64_12250, partial [Candidatus Cloacimonetes bacterium]|nr:hypothetical protein [Candidatus Cloacimonadota bacterium]MDY0230852.1 hypothetical protein [Candidatus Cloacimonadaceae bacterium]